MAQATETAIWQGTTGAGSFEGFSSLFADAQFATDGGQVITPGTITSSNVIAELGKVVDAIPYLVVALGAVTSFTTG